MNGNVKSAVRVLEILELLARSSGSVSLKEVTDELDYPKSSAFQLLATLVSRGYALRDEGDRYRLNEACRTGPGWTSGTDAQLMREAKPLMDELREACGESVLLGVLMRDGRLRTIAKSIGTQPVRYDAQLVGGLPSYCSALGRVLLAYSEPALVDRYLAHERLAKLTEFTIVDRLEIRRRLEEVRRDGFAISDQEMDIAGSGVAAPIFGAEGNVVAALDIAAVSQRFAANKAAYIRAVVDYAARISASSAPSAIRPALGPG